MEHFIAMLLRHGIHRSVNDSITGFFLLIILRERVG